MFLVSQGKLIVTRQDKNANQMSTETETYRVVRNILYYKAVIANTKHT